MLGSDGREGAFDSAAGSGVVDEVDGFDVADGGGDGDAGCFVPLGVVVEDGGQADRWNLEPGLLVGEELIEQGG